jgi:hypothetical protein
VLGGTLSLQLGNLGPPPAGLCLGMLGVSKTSWNGVPLPLDLGVIGAPSCPLLISPLLTTVVVNANGTAVWDSFFPVQADLIGQDLYAQALVFDAGANPFGAVTSNGGEGILR